MDKVLSTFRLLALFSIFFIYQAIKGAIEENVNNVILWSLITLVYIASLIVLYFVLRRWEKEKIN
ncbi:MAG: hypothetical protein ACXADU_12135 [Promethearchaeota archaeon]|jgi:uncharacterized sodium:solute symporter family permease YidK